MPLQFDNLRFSPKHTASPNPDEATSNWPEIYFWTSGLMLLNWVPLLLERLPSLSAKAQEFFWKGSMPSQFMDDLPWIAKFPPAQVVEYCQVRQSRDRAKTRLIIRATGERENPKGAESAVALGDILMEERRFILNAAAKSKSVGHSALPGLIHKAAKRNDVRFFIQLGKALQSKRRPVDVDWNRAGCDPVACLLVNNWCEGRDYKSRLPALCFFSDQALADFFCAALGRRPGNPSLDGIRKWRCRLGLKQATSPKVKRTTITSGEVLFVMGK